MGDKYQPSNGTEGEWFVESHCMCCINCDPDPNGPKQCSILLATLVYDARDARYPEEWTYTAQGKPTCTAWVKWDWGQDGDPDDRDNPKAPPVDDPRQLVLPFLFDEIGIPQQLKSRL